MPRTATAERVDRDGVIQFRRPRHRAVLLTRRRAGGVQLSPVTCGVDGEGRIVVSTYPQRAKVAAITRQGKALLPHHADRLGSRGDRWVFTGIIDKD